MTAAGETVTLGAPRPGGTDGAPDDVVPAAEVPAAEVPAAEVPAEPTDDELAARLRVAVTRLNRRLRQQSLAGLSPAQASALGSVNRLGTPTLGELALAEQVQPPTMTRLVASMETAGLLVRVADPVDRRVCRVRLTAEGRRALQRIRSLKNAYLARRLAELATRRAGRGGRVDRAARTTGARPVTAVRAAAARPSEPSRCAITASTSPGRSCRSRAPGCSP